MAPPNRPADLPKSTNDTTYFSFGCKIFVSASCFQLTSVGENPTYFRTFATDRKQVDFGREKGVFPLVLIQVKSAAKRTFFGLKNKREKAFLPFKTQLSHIQVVRYAASGNNITTWLSISYIDSKAIILVENHLNRGKMGCFRSHIFSCLLIITVFLSPSCPPVRLRGTKLCPKHILDTYNLKNW